MGLLERQSYLCDLRVDDREGSNLVTTWADAIQGSSDALSSVGRCMFLECVL